MLTREQQQLHDAHMAQAPVPYRGFEIRPLSHQGRPFLIRGESVFQGWNVIKDSTLWSPGSVWFRTVGEAKNAIDCIHEAGGADNPNCASWATRFWELMKECALCD